MSVLFLQVSLTKMLILKEKRCLKFLQQFQRRLPETSRTAKVILGTMLTKEKRYLKSLQHLQTRLPI